MRAFSRVIFSAWFLLSTVWSLDITKDKIDRGTITINNEDITIRSGAFWSIVNNAITSFISNVNVEPGAALYVSSVSSQISLTATLLGDTYSIVNDGVISLNAITGAAYYFFDIMGKSMINNGDMFLSGSGDTATTVYMKANNWQNYGLIQLYQKKRTSGVVYLGNHGLTANNNGQICFFNQLWLQTANVLGTGCVTATANSSFYFSNTALTISSNQTFYLADGSTSIVALGSVTPLTFTVKGFGQVDGVSNKIGLAATLYNPKSGQNPWLYNATTEILTLYVGNYVQNFKIGPGYNDTKFSVVTDKAPGLPGPDLGSVMYNGPVPNPGLPVECKPCKSIPAIPGIDATSYTTTLTTTSAGSIYTDNAIVAISTNTNGIFTTSTVTRYPQPPTSLFLSTWTTSHADGSLETGSGLVTQSGTSFSTLFTIPPPVQTKFTSTWTTTHSDGSVETESGLVSQSGTSFTTLSTFEPAVQTEFTKTWTTTHSDGSVETESGLVSQSGTSFTTLSTFEPAVQTEFTSTWTTTHSDRSVETKSGLVSQSGTSYTTLSTFEPAVQTEFTKTWTTTHSDGSVETESGLVSQSGTSHTTLITYRISSEVSFYTRWVNSSSSDIPYSGTIGVSEGPSNRISSWLTVSASKGGADPSTSSNIMSTESVTTGVVSTDDGVTGIKSESVIASVRTVEVSAPGPTSGMATSNESDMRGPQETGTCSGDLVSSSSIDSEPIVGPGVVLSFPIGSVVATSGDSSPTDVSNSCSDIPRTGTVGQTGEENTGVASLGAGAGLSAGSAVGSGGSVGVAESTMMSQTRGLLSVNEDPTAVGIVSATRTGSVTSTTVGSSYAHVTAPTATATTYEGSASTLKISSITSLLLLLIFSLLRP
ncbi:hypothetical protein CANMA_000335 [Candida margitis]|uniref:uncharacterized protein n=1 Tax=Candida margitis TaxID=1775924 RepID=UPI00222774BC|nr:uncharacterized protein CANMA_000335 [Candida margitis]KAI5970594.1 hypothetical protein CANMA_000335 [Candida margitis]